MKYSILAIAITTGLQANPAFAEETTVNTEIEKVVVVSSRVAMPLREIATSVTLLSKEDLAASGQINLSQVLNTQAAIYTSQSGGIGATTALRIRGEEGFRTLVRIDGIDISDPTGPQVSPDLAHLSSSNLARVEILRGSQGLVYGADAGGVINVFTERVKQDFTANIQAEMGSYDSRNVAANVGGNVAELDYFVALADYSTDGFNATLADTSSETDGYQNTTVHGRLTWQPTNDFSTEIVYRDTQGDTQFDNCGFAATASNDCMSLFGQSHLRLASEYQHADSIHQLAINKSHIDRENLNQGSQEFTTKGEVTQVEYLGQTELSDNQQLVYGLDWQNQQITNSNQSRDSHGLYLEYQGEFARSLFFTLGIRYDDNQDFGSFTSGRVSGAYIWTVGDQQLKLRGAYGTGFRAPSLSEIAYNEGPFAYPPAADTKLKEEHTKGHELALDYLWQSGSHVEFVYFSQQITDSIEFDLLGYSGYLQDIGRATSKGFELISKTKLNSRLSFNANYTYNQTQDTQGLQRVRRPQHLANLALAYQFDNFWLSANVRMVKDLVDVVFDNTTFSNVRVDLDDYQVVDLHVKYALSSKLTVSGRIDNLFDQQYQDLANFYTSGEAAHLGLRYHF